MKNDKNDPFKPVLNWRTGEVEYEFSGGIILGKNGKTRVKVADDVAVDVGSGRADIVSPIFWRRKKK